MADTAKQLGREPHKHHIHESVAAADVYVGRPGELTMVRTSTGEPIVEARLHDGVGKSVVLKALPSGSVAAMLPPAVVVPPMTATASAGIPVSFNHGLGYFPMVQALDAAGNIADVQIVHDDAENISLTFAANDTYTIILR